MRQGHSVIPESGSLFGGDLEKACHCHDFKNFWMKSGFDGKEQILSDSQQSRVF